MHARAHAGTHALTHSGTIQRAEKKKATPSVLADHRSSVNAPVVAQRPPAPITKQLLAAITKVLTAASKKQVLAATAKMLGCTGCATACSNKAGGFREGLLG